MEKYTQFIARMTVSEKQKLQEDAKNKGMTASAYVRDLIAKNRGEKNLDIEKAIRWLDQEILYLKNAPNINACEMTDEWKEQMAVMQVLLKISKEKIATA